MVMVCGATLRLSVVPTDGAIRPFVDAVENERGLVVEEEDEQEGVLPDIMLGIRAAALPTATTTAGKSRGNLPANQNQTRSKRVKGLEQQEPPQNQRCMKRGMRFKLIMCGRDVKLKVLG